MNILLVGSGGREHALAWKIAQSPQVTRLVAAPGNPGMAAVAEVRPVAATDVEGLVALAKEIGADLVVIGPETSVAAGLADVLGGEGIACFGPTMQAGQLESSKAFTKAFADRYGLPTAAYVVAESADDAKRALDRFDAPYVVKADGLAAGKGVVVATTRGEAEAAIDDALGGRFGSAGSRVVIEEFLDGEIGSLFALCDGKTAMLFGWAQDHKRAFDGEQGPNTGGMGTYSPAPVFTPELVEQIRQRLVEPAFAGIAAEGAPYRGVLFVELMATQHGPKLVEFNVRFGDPECQVLMLRLESDLVPYLQACASGTLDQMPPPVWRDEAAVCVVVAAEGYPGTPKAGGEIRGADADLGDQVVIFHAGTKRDADGTLRAAGGRVLNVCARGASLQQARDKAYAAVDAIDFADGFCRRDIGWRALTR
ncbi:phosphoribosylamine--glycine ligase [Phenylobacterium deserti]|uniref:Phosphoribosylamine--glycine ligase n=1 Tax=Phenylobacterium deserti TaxID=1914756 RepID=A0A328AS51_9CAUL|nr:phosphoribosylamine--glycine ligase [Phenylobacterium deserti]RAK57882.1 phosphoribosylamine--glycine ligase [Phenylobacterium deserti]